MREQVIQVVEQYIDAVRRNDGFALPLHPDAVCDFQYPVDFGNCEPARLARWFVSFVIRI